MQKCAFVCVCMCDSLLPLRKMKRSVWPGAQREEIEKVEGEREKCTCSLNEGSCVKEIQRKRESFVGCRVLLCIHTTKDYI